MSETPSRRPPAPREARHPPVSDDCPQQAMDGAAITLPIEASVQAPAAKLTGQRHQLLVWLGETVVPWPLPPRGDLIVGRAANSDIQIESPAVSRQHARLVVRPDCVSVVDVDSHNGTRVNGERLIAPRALAYGDIVTFGDVTSVLGEARRPGVTPLHGAASSEDAFATDDRASRALETLQTLQTLQIGDRSVLVADPAMAHVYTQLARLAPTDLTVLILGETGAGKELAASALRLWSKRQNRPIVSINCAALPGELAESELFGYERGAFSGAAASKQGLLEAASGGTVLFDEIGDLPLPVQAKLLRVIETRRLTRLGAVREQTIDLRVIAATHRDLEEGVRVGWFRADLYYRLGVAIVRIPPLRLRRRELPLLARRFLEESCRMLGRPPLVLDEEAHACLLAHDWPGNVRELKNLIDCVAVAATGTIINGELVRAHLRGASDASGRLNVAALSAGQPATDGNGGERRGFSDETGPVGPGLPLAEANRAFERRTIEAALTETHGNKTHAAKRLGVPLRTFMDKIKRYGL